MISYNNERSTAKNSSSSFGMFCKCSEIPAVSSITLIVFITRNIISLSIHCVVLYLLVVCQSMYTCTTRQLWVKQDFNVSDLKKFDNW